jgi:hypothetical protein
VAVIVDVGPVKRHGNDHRGVLFHSAEPIQDEEHLIDRRHSGAQVDQEESSIALP